MPENTDSSPDPAESQVDGSSRASPRRPLVFLHLPKTAGTTLKAIIEDVYTPDGVLNLRVADGGVRRLFAMPPLERDRFDVIAGHLDWRVARLMPSSKIITVLREPADRFLSWYYYALRNENAPLHAELNADGGDIERAIVSGRYAPQYNIMTQMLRDPAVTDAAAAVESAKRNLSSCLAFGLSERFTESVRLMERVLDWPTTSWEDRNVTANRPALDDLSADARAALAEGCAPDASLYAFGAELFAKRLNAS